MERKCGRTRDLFKKVKEVTFTLRLSDIEAKGGNNHTEEADIRKRWKEYTEELYKRDGQMTEIHPEQTYAKEPGILECEVRRVLHEIRKQ